MSVTELIRQVQSKDCCNRRIQLIILTLTNFNDVDKLTSHSIVAESLTKLIADDERDRFGNG